MPVRAMPYLSLRDHHNDFIYGREAMDDVTCASRRAMPPPLSSHLLGLFPLRSLRARVTTEDKMALRHWRVDPVSLTDVRRSGTGYS